MSIFTFWPMTSSASNPNNSRIYKIRNDWATLTHDHVREEAGLFYNVEPGNILEEMTTAIINQYKTDWFEWPVDRGAPYYDINNNERYDPEIDVPGLLDADQVIWFVV